MKDILQATRNPLDIAETLDIPTGKARVMVEECDFDLDGWGRLHMQKYIISRKHVSAEWPHQHGPRLLHYRKLHDQGRVTMCQGRDGAYIIQYAIPNNPPVKRETYFYAEKAY